MIEMAINYLVRESLRGTTARKFTRRDGVRALLSLGIRSEMARSFGDLVARQANAALEVVR